MKEMIYNSSKNLGLCCRYTFLSRDSWCTLTTYWVLHKGGNGFDLQLVIFHAWINRVPVVLPSIQVSMLAGSLCASFEGRDLDPGKWVGCRGSLVDNWLPYLQKAVLTSFMEQLQRVSFAILGTWEEQWIIGQSLRKVFWPKAAVD